MATVKQVSYAPGGELLPPVPHRPGVLLLQLRPEADRPLIVATPCVDHAFRVRLGQAHTVDASHRRERADAAREAAGQLLNLADLALRGLAVAVVFGLDVVIGTVEGAGCVDDVRVEARLENVQLGLARTGQPRVNPSLNGRPVRDDELPTLGRDQRRPQHPAQNVGNALAELGDDGVVPAHGGPDILGGFSALAGEVVNLGAVAAGPASGAAAREHERASDSAVLLVGQLGQAVELGDG